MSDLTASIPKPQDFQAIVEILNNNATQLQDMHQLLKTIAITFQHISSIVDSQLRNTTNNKEAKTCLPNISANILSHNISSQTSIPHSFHESVSSTSNTTFQKTHPNIDSFKICPSINNNCNIIAKSSSSRRISGKEIHRIITSQKV